jgi:hypothetical protein
VDLCNLQQSDDPDDALGHSRSEKIRELDHNLRALTSRLDDELGTTFSNAHIKMQNIEKKLSVSQKHQDETNEKIIAMRELSDVLQDQNTVLGQWIEESEKTFNSKIDQMSLDNFEVRRELDALVKYLGVEKTNATDGDSGDGSLDMVAKMHIFKHQVEDLKNQSTLLHDQLKERRISSVAKGKALVESKKAARMALAKKVMDPVDARVAPHLVKGQTSGSTPTQALWR